MSPERCADLSREAGEPLHATATTAVHWLLVEVRGPWPRDVGADDALPGTARRAVHGWLARTPDSRLLFLRRPGRASGALVAFVVRAGEGDAAVRRLDLVAGHGQLAQVDLDRDGDRVDGGLVLVCGHGTRDPCCALRGAAVYGALDATLDEHALWLSSHHGGHRFAANVLVLPAGLHFGRVEPGEAPLVVAGALAGTISLDRYRGRTCYDLPTQAAEHAVRTSAGLDGVDDLRLLDVEGPLVRFAEPHGAVHAASVETLAGPVVPASCGAPPEPQETRAARLA